MYALPGQRAADFLRGDPPEDPAREALDAFDAAIERAQLMLAAAESARGRNRTIEAYGHAEDARALLNGINTGSRVRLS